MSECVRKKATVTVDVTYGLMLMTELSDMNEIPSLLWSGEKSDLRIKHLA